MPFDPPEPAAEPLVSAPSRAPRFLLLAGFSAACLLGGGLGFWARPSDLKGASATTAAPQAARQIEIRVDRPAEASEPATARPATVEAPPAPELLAPKPAPEGLLRVHEVTPLHLTEALRPGARPAPAQKSEARNHRSAVTKAEKPKPVRRAQAKAPLTRPPTARVAMAAPSKSARPKPAHSRPTRVRDQTPVRTASLRPRCASDDPGAALPCADLSLGAAERQLNRAYREAEAAGVPAATLRRQQQRWLAARAAAVRDAPWAVHDVYVARIAELQDQTRRAVPGEQELGD